MADISTVAFRTSALGRFGHVAMAFAAGAVASLLGTGLLLRVVSVDKLALWLGTAALFVTCAAATLYCLGFAIKRGDRIICGPEQLTYRGLLRARSIPWQSVTEFWLDFGGRSPFVHLVVRTDGRWLPYYFNLSGLTPSYAVIVELFRANTPGAKVWLPKFYDQIMRTQSSVPLAIRETAFDDPLTVVRSDTPQAARRSTQR